MPNPLDPSVYDHLRRLAHRIHQERGSGGETIAPTALLHEAWAKIARNDHSFANRGHFCAVAARAMRQILVDRARGRGRLKRGENPQRTTISGLSGPSPTVDLLELDDAIERLGQEDAVAADVVVLRAFGGLTVPECAEALGVSPRSINSKWRFARAYLATELDPS